MNSEEAKNLYKELCLHDNSRMGPQAFFQADQNLLNRLFSLQKELVVSDSIIKVESPWHAALFCLSLVLHTAIDETPSIVDTDNITVVSKKTRFVFRGVSDAGWPCAMVPKLDRLQGDKQRYERATRAVQAFCGLMDYLVNPYLGVPFQHFLAIAQHYELPTRLLDFTVDPSVAVFFACHGKVYRKNQEAVVFIMPLDKALDYGVRFILAPPFVRRMYVQRALFLEPKENESDRLAQLCLQVHFPSCPYQGSFLPVRQNGELSKEELLKKDKWIESAKGWAEEWSKKGKPFPPNEGYFNKFKRNRIITDALKKVGRPSWFWPRAESQPAIFQEWFDFATEILYWTAIKMIHSNGQWWEGVDNEFLNAIVRDNEALFHLMSKLCLVYSKQLEIAGHQQRASNLLRVREVLLRHLQSLS
jgi:hypothetical protein